MLGAKVERFTFRTPHCGVGEADERRLRAVLVAFHFLRLSNIACMAFLAASRS
jgi:hypothetical protein